MSADQAPATGKRLVLMRHAKSSWKHAELSDFDRPLNRRGRSDAPAMGRRLQRRGLRPDLILASAAVRTRATAAALAEALDLAPGAVRLEEALYLASAERLLALLQALDDTLHQVVLVAHNPGITDLVNRFGVREIDNLPTAGYADFAFEVPSWGLVEAESARLLALDYPKNPSSAAPGPGNPERC